MVKQQSEHGESPEEAGEPSQKSASGRQARTGRSKQGSSNKGSKAGRKGSAETKGGEKASSSEGPKVSPTGDMLTAHLLAMLNGWSAYGYELAQRLEESGLGQYNKGSIYRILRQMEDSGLVSSSWDTSKDGPARRIYDLTDLGSMFLKNWMTMAEMHRNFLRSMVELNPLMSSMSNRRSGDRTNSGESDDGDADPDRRD
jgi:poly-beta-hydroxybutyrate-responsive repressor